MSLRSLLAPPLMGWIAAACSSPAAYPSLLPRPAETQSLAEPPAPVPQPAAADPALDARIAAALRTLGERTAAFEAAALRTARAVAAAGRAPAGSAAWLDAQVTLAELDTLRSAALEVVGDLDAIAGERASALAPDYPTLDAAIERARAAGEAQRARIAALQAALAPA